MGKKRSYDSSKTIAENQRARNWCLVIYPEDQSHFEAMNELMRGYKFVAILHDQDKKEDNPEEFKKPHWHVVLKFPQARWKTAIAESLKIEPNYLQVCRDLSGAYNYLCHVGLPDLHQYPHTSLFGPLYNEAVKAMEHESDQNQRVLTLLHLLDAQGITNERKFMELACENGLYGDFIRMGSLISKLVEIHNDDYNLFRELPDDKKNPFK